MKRLLPFAACVVAGCSTTQGDLQGKTEPVVRTYTENYQEIFRRVSSAAKRCQSGNVGATSSFEVDAQLYSELGYGEVSQSLVNFGTRNYYWTAKIEKTDVGSTMTVNSGNTLASSSLTTKVLGWADGKEAC